MQRWHDLSRWLRFSGWRWTPRARAPSILRLHPPLAHDIVGLIVISLVVELVALLHERRARRVFDDGFDRLGLQVGTVLLQHGVLPRVPTNGLGSHLVECTCDRSRRGYSRRYSFNELVQKLAVKYLKGSLSASPSHKTHTTDFRP